MSKVITFSRVFPATHPKKGELTFFVEKILTSLNMAPADMEQQVKDIINVHSYFCGDFKPKKHTIRRGKRWKAGDKFSPRVWSGRP